MSEEKTTFYTILGLEQNATETDIKNAYRTKALNLHPDKNPNLSDAQKIEFQKIQDAYQILSDSAKKKIYDQQLTLGIDLDLTNISVTNTSQIYFNQLSSLNGEDFIGKVKELLDTFEQSFKESQQASMQFFLECFFDFQAFLQGWKQAYTAKISADNYVGKPGFVGEGGSSLIDKIDDVIAFLKQQNTEQNNRISTIQQEYMSMFQRFSKAHLLWAASESLNWFKKHKGDDSCAEVAISINEFSEADLHSGNEAPVLGKLVFTFTGQSKDFLLSGDDEDLFLTAFKQFAKIQTKEDIVTEYKKTGHRVTVTISPDLATQPIEQILSQVGTLSENDPEERQAQEEAPNLGVGDGGNKESSTYSLGFFSQPKQPKSIESDDDILKRNLLAYIEKRSHGAVYTGSWLGFDRTTKLEAAELLFKVKFLNQDPTVLLDNQKLIGALTQGKLGDLAASAVTDLIEQRRSSSLSPQS